MILPTIMGMASSVSVLRIVTIHWFFRMSDVYWFR